MRTIVIVLALTIALMASSVYTSQSSDGEFLGDTFTLELTDSDGNDLSDPLFGKVTIYFDTFSTSSGVIYKLKAMLSINTVPANVLISSSGGLFQFEVAATGAGSFLEETGLSFTITDGEDIYVADLKKSNNYHDVFKDSGTVATLEPNIYYSISANLIDGYESTVTPESVKDITITFQATASQGFHEVVFVSEGEVIESYIVFDNYVIQDVPSVSRSGYTFNGWFTPDGRQITDGFIVTPDEGDILAVAEWEKDDNNNTLLYIAGGGGIAAALALLLLLALKRRKQTEAS